MIARLLPNLAILAVSATTLATAASLGARAEWFFELFSHFPVQILVVQVAALVVCLGFRHWLWAVVALFSAVPNYSAVAPYLPGLFSPPATSASSGMPAKAPVRLIAANLLYRRHDPAAARAYFAAQSADILVLEEFTPWWHEKLRQLERSYPYFALRSRADPWGMAVYSRYPFREIENLDLDDDRTSQLRVLVQLPDGPAEVYAVHLISPTSPHRAGQRNTQLKKLVVRIAAADPGLPKIIAGDLNSTPYSPYFADLLRDTDLRDGRRPFGLHVTWPAWLVPAWIPIDHCLVSKTVVVMRVAAGPRIGSDHLPVECTFSLAR